MPQPASFARCRLAVASAALNCLCRRGRRSTDSQSARRCRPAFDAVSGSSHWYRQQIEFDADLTPLWIGTELIDSAPAIPLVPVTTAPLSDDEHRFSFGEPRAVVASAIESASSWPAGIVSRPYPCRIVLLRSEITCFTTRLRAPVPFQDGVSIGPDGVSIGAPKDVSVAGCVLNAQHRVQRGFAFCCAMVAQSRSAPAKRRRAAPCTCVPISTTTARGVSTLIVVFDSWSGMVNAEMLRLCARRRSQTFVDAHAGLGRRLLAGGELRTTA